MQKIILINYQKYKNYHDNFLHIVFNIINIKKIVHISQHIVYHLI